MCGVSSDFVCCFSINLLRRSTIINGVLKHFQPTCPLVSEWNFSIFQQTNVQLVAPLLHNTRKRQQMKTHEEVDVQSEASLTSSTEDEFSFTHLLFTSGGN
jgi:hypothetical protein